LQCVLSANQEMVRLQSHLWTLPVKDKLLEKNVGETVQMPAGNERMSFACSVQTIPKYIIFARPTETFVC
jgi:hypothetical protein